MTRLVAPNDVPAQRLDVFISSAINQSRSQVAHLLKHGLITLNHGPARASYIVQPKDIIEVQLPAAPGSPSVPELTIVYEDAEVLVVDKPSGLIVHPPGITSTPSVADFARTKSTDPDPNRPGIVHRLDRDTSGLLIIAKSAAAKASLQHEFRKHDVDKVYLALVIGTPQPPAATINLPLGRNPSRPLRRVVTTAGKPALTSYTTSQTYAGYSLLELRPQTGRTHQIRVHMASVGHPIAGDIEYGPKIRPLGLKRQFLHAAKLTFTTPGGRKLHLVSPLPPDLEAVLARLQNQV